MTDLSNLKFFSTEPHNCSYLSDREAVTLFADPEATLNNQHYSQLSQLGFRRSGKFLYRPHCNNCQACIPIRVPSQHFRPTRNQRRALTRNQEITVTATEPKMSDETYNLYERYINMRHKDGDMYPPSKEQFESFLINPLGQSIFFEFRGEEDQLLAVAVTDVVDDGLSAIYTFYEPEEEQRSLGRLAIVWQIQHVKNLGLPYLYLGYLIEECQKMSYKAEYQPQQCFKDGQWQYIAKN